MLQAECDGVNLTEFMAGRVQKAEKATQEASKLKGAPPSLSHRCLDSMLAKDNIFTLPLSQTVQTLSSPALVFTSAIGIAPLNPISSGVGMSLPQQ